MAGKQWSRDEVLAAFNVYCRTPFGRLHARNPEIGRLAEALGRSANSVAMKCCNLAAFDPDLAQKGLSKGSKLDRAIWDEFHAEPERMGYESELKFAELLDRPPRQAKTLELRDVQGLDREAITKVRVNQRLFRWIILAGYNNACAICGLPIPQLLVAAHIVPWSADPALRMNPRKGICLCALHDKAFDTGILRVASDYRISISIPVLRNSTNETATDSTAVFLLAFDGERLRLPERWLPDARLLSRR